MDHTFDTVDEKLAEAEFFLRQMAQAGMDMFAFKCFLSAYLSASRTTTLALQQFKHLPGFDAWYKPHRERLQADPLAKFFLEARNNHVHGGPYPVSGGMFHGDLAHYYFEQPNRHGKQHERKDIVTTCREHLIKLLEIVYDCYVQLGIYIDPQQHYTKEHFVSLGRTIDDAELEIWGWIRTSLIDEGYSDDARWQEVRSRVSECKINHLFYSYYSAR